MRAGGMAEVAKEEISQHTEPVAAPISVDDVVVDSASRTTRAEYAPK